MTQALNHQSLYLSDLELMLDCNFWEDVEQ
jgi:hypothetical protein